MTVAFFRTDEVSCKKKFLFHYTSAESFFKIIKAMELMPSSVAQLNDLNEANVHNLQINDWNLKILCQRYIKEHFYTISFSKGYEENPYSNGANHPALWAHYAESLNGVCIAIDEEKFIETNSDILSKTKYVIEDIEYCNINGTREEELTTHQDVETFINLNIKPLFFRKHKDWSHEDERRLLLFEKTKNLSIFNCVEYVILGSKFVTNDSKMNKLSDVISNSNNRCYKQFIPNSFAKVSYGERGYFNIEAQFLIRKQFEKLYKNHKELKLFIDWYSNEDIEIKKE